MQLDFGRTELQPINFQPTPTHFSCCCNSKQARRHRIMAQPFNLWQPVPLLHYQPVLDVHGNTVRLGEGGFAAVFLYRNSNTGEQVAIKRVRLTNLPLSKAKLVIKYMPSE